MAEPIRDRLRSILLKHFPGVRPLPAQGALQPGVGHRPRVRTDERCIGYVEYSEETLPDPLPARLVAFYLPQFHTIPENDEWWGKGFTEWRNVTRAVPQFEGHLQPRLPGDLGFYDLRNPEVMREQAKLAKTYGLSAFCFYFYWFGGKTLLEEPLRNWLSETSIDFQYCLCWANENWTRRWDGRGDEVLIAQKHSPEDDIAFIQHVADYLRDPRYLRVDGQPMLLIYRPTLLPNPKSTVERWRRWCRENGIGEIHLAYVQSFERPSCSDIGFDSAVEFPPNTGNSREITAEQSIFNPGFKGEIRDWRVMTESFKSRPTPAYLLHRGVNCGWDNEPRRPGAGLVYTHVNPLAYANWLGSIIERHASPSHQHPLVFINAWNEWAEGAQLEPDLQSGHSRLAWTRRAITSTAGRRKRHDAVGIIHVYYPDDLPPILEGVRTCGIPVDVVVTSPERIAPTIQRILREARIPHELRIHENRGRDILPFLVEANRLALAGYDLVLKLHTKRSPHLTNGAAWGRHIVETLLEPRNVERVMETAQSGQLGFACASTCLTEMPSTDANAARVTQLLKAAGIPQRGKLAFCAGSMFWSRLPLLMPLLSQPLRTGDFDEEPLPVDGTLAHAIERTFIEIATSSGSLLSLEPPSTPPELPYGLG